MSKDRIIVVEDEVIIALEIENNLQNQGYEVTSVVNSGEDVIKKRKKTNRISSRMHGIFRMIEQ